MLAYEEPTFAEAWASAYPFAGIWPVLWVQGHRDGCFRALCPLSFEILAPGR
jgi:hypothetical protein